MKLNRAYAVALLNSRDVDRRTTTLHPLRDDEFALIRNRMENVVSHLWSNRLAMGCIPRLRVTASGKSPFVFYAMPE
jgi:hypothetical protein